MTAKSKYTMSNRRWWAPVRMCTRLVLLVATRSVLLLRIESYTLPLPPKSLQSPETLQNPLIPLENHENDLYSCSSDEFETIFGCTSCLLLDKSGACQEVLIQDGRSISSARFCKSDSFKSLPHTESVLLPAYMNEISVSH